LRDAPPDAGLLLGYGVVEHEAVVTGIARLAEVYRKLVGARQASPATPGR